MTLEQFYTYQEQTFDSFCMTLIRHTAATIHTQLTTQAIREKSLSSLTLPELAQLSTEDDYDLDSMTFSVIGEPVTIRDPALYKALQYISPKMREVILLFYFLEQNEKQIGRVLNMSKSGVNKRHKETLARLREILEAEDNE